MQSLNRHLLVLALAAFVPLALVAVVFAGLLVHEKRERTEQALTQSATLLARALDGELQRSFAALQALARSDSLKRGDLRSFYTEAEDIRRSLGIWDNVLLLSPGADHLLNLRRPYGAPLPPLPQPEGTLEAARTARPFVSNVLRGRVETDWLMYIAYPAIHDGAVKYVIGVTMDHRYWSRWLAERLPGDTLATIVDRNFLILARTRHAEQFAGQPVQPWYRERLRVSTEPLVRGLDVAGNDAVSSFGRSEVSGWTVTVFTSGAVIDAPFRFTTAVVSAALAAALLLALALAYTRAAVLARGIRGLRDALDALKESGRPPPLRSSIAEIQEAMRAAETTADTLASRSEGLRRAQEAARMGLWDWDVVSGQVTWSAGIYRLLGLEEGCVAPSFEIWMTKVLADDRDRLRSELTEVLDRAREFELEFRVSRADGEVRWLVSIGTVDRNAAGAAVRLQGVNIDITERKEAELALRRSEYRFRTISNAAPAFVWVRDQEGRVTFLNERWGLYTGQTEAQARDGGWSAAVHPADVAPMAEGWMRSVATGATYECECRYRRHDGTYRWHVVRALPMRRADGTIEQWVGCAVDIHDAREAEAALREADRRKDEFLATLAHELRNPLAPVRNALQLMRRAPASDGALPAAREMMERQVAQMVRLIDDLLDVSRISRGRLELRREPVELAKVVEQAVETSRAAITQRFSVSLPDDAIYVDADPVRLAQVIANLLNNAAKYTDRNGRIELVAKLEATEVSIAVRDDGIGIERENLSRVFEMFSQVRSTLDRAQGGLGIGLALARSLVELHGGRIEARSEGLGQGSEFILTLPALATPDRIQESVADVEYRGAARRVLVVDDLEDNVRSMTALLARDGHVVDSAADGLEAVAHAERFKPDFILLDLGLPHLSGIEACRMIRRAPWGRGIVIVALTGWGQAHDRESTKAAGFDHHLVKPVAYADVQRLLGSVLVA